VTPGRTARTLAAAAATLLALAIGGCSITVGTSHGMTGSAGGNQAGMMGGFGAGMMGGAPLGYHLSPLSCQAPSSLPGASVYVMLGDMGMTHAKSGVAPLGGHMMLRALPAQVPAGQVSFVVGNMGWRVHELVVLPLAPGQQAGQRAPDEEGEVDESDSLGEASASCAEGSGEGIEAGTVGWITLDLPEGRYELVCNLPNHYANGMYQEFTVTA